MIELGRYCLVAALILCAYGFVAAFWGGYRKQLPFIRSSEHAVIANFVLCLVAATCLWVLIFQDQFQVRYVAMVSSRNQPALYKFTSLWGQQSGSLLFWSLILALFSSIFVLQNRKRNRALVPYANGVLLGSSLFFLILLNFAATPFQLAPRIVADGVGLNPLLQNSYMVIHPPALYLGFICLNIPFAIAMGALLSGELNTTWVASTRKWGLIGWCFLTFGIALGGMWAYEELGWGGYWAWDPVENASFMPWLVATAFLHSIMITEKKGMLKAWNFVLILLAFELTIFGTFLTRSGVIESVHSFALSNIGPFFVVFLAISSLFGMFMIFYRSGEMQSGKKMQSFLSREFTFLLNNWLFVSICFAVFWGSVFPVLSEWVTGEKITVGAPFFNKVTAPLWLALLILTGICPLIAWRKASSKNFQRNFVYPIVGGVVAGLVCLGLGIRAALPLILFSSAGFVAMTIFFEFYKGARARQAIRPSSFIPALVDLTVMNKRRYGGFVIHGGIVLVFVGITASSFFDLDQFFTVREGESFSLGRYTMVYKGMSDRRDPEKDVFSARLDVSAEGNILGGLRPEKHIHHTNQDQPQTEVAIRSTPRDDLYVALSTWDEETATFHVFVKPLVMLIWIGVAVMVLGGLFVLIPNQRKAVARVLKRPAAGEIRDEAA